MLSYLSSWVAIWPPLSHGPKAWILKWEYRDNMVFTSRWDSWSNFRSRAPDLKLISCWDFRLNPWLLRSCFEETLTPFLSPSLTQFHRYYTWSSTIGIFVVHPESEEGREGMEIDPLRNVCPRRATRMVNTVADTALSPVSSSQVPSPHLLLSIWIRFKSPSSGLQSINYLSLCMSCSLISRVSFTSEL